MHLRLLARPLFALLFGTAIGLDDLDEPSRRRIRAAQIDAVVALVPLTMTINILNVAVVDVVFWDVGATNVFLAIWSVVIILQAAAGFWSWFQSRSRRPTGASRRAIRRTATYAAVLAFSWGAMPLALFPHADLTRQLLLASLIAGMISGGAFGLSTVPAAGLAYTWMIVIPSVVALILAGNHVVHRGGVFAAALRGLPVTQSRRPRQPVRRPPARPN